MNGLAWAAGIGIVLKFSGVLNLRAILLRCRCWMKLMGTLGGAFYVIFHSNYGDHSIIRLLISKFLLSSWEI